MRTKMDRWRVYQVSTSYNMKDSGTLNQDLYTSELILESPYCYPHL